MDLLIIILGITFIELAVGVWLVRSANKFTRRMEDQHSWPRAGKISKEADYKLKLGKDQRIK